jgi:hypothetical protein
VAGCSYSAETGAVSPAERSPDISRAASAANAALNPFAVAVGHLFEIDQPVACHLSPARAVAFRIGSVFPWIQTGHGDGS